MSSKPIGWQRARVEISPFAKGKNITDATTFAKQKERDYNSGKNIGFSYTSSLKSMGRIPRSNGEYVLGAKYKNV